MPSQKTQMILVAVCSVIGVVVISPRDCLAGGSTCVTRATIQVCVEWGKPADPVEGVHFRVDFTDPLNPDIELITGDPEWRVWSRSTGTGAPTNIGSLTIDPTVSTDDFVVRIANGDDPGAADVGSIVLTARDWLGHSSIAPNSFIFGDLTTDLTLVRDSSGDGGRIGGLRIGGDVKVDDLGYLWIDGDSSGDIEARVLSSGWVRFWEELSGDVRITEKVEHGHMTSYGNVTAASTIEIADMASIGSLQSSLAFNAGGEYGEREFAGDLVLTNGLPEDQFVFILGHLTSTGSVDLNGKDIESQLTVMGGSGSVLNGGAVKGEGQLVLGYTSLTFSGTATMASVSGPYGLVVTDGGHLDGTLNVTGDVAGKIVIGSLASSGAGHLMSKGTISVGGDVSGEIDVQGYAEGDIEVDGDVTDAATIKVGENLKSTGRILVEGFCDGAIAIAEETVSLSLVHLEGGLGDDGSVTVNASEGLFDASGAIHVGQAESVELPPITFDGSIMIKQGPTRGGDLNGTITVVGCHATDDDLDICICGGDGEENILIQQTDCEHQVEVVCSSTCN